MENVKKEENSNFQNFLNVVENKEDKLVKINYDLALIAEKEIILQKSCDELKTEFIGLDDSIDQLLMYIRPWFLMPETLRRPVVVSLWGMTGVGKTTLVQALVEKLKMSHAMVSNDIGKFVVSENGYNEGALIHGLANLSGQSGVLFFDEIQIARTLTEDGREIDRPSLRSFWTLLDVGKIEVHPSILLDKKNYWKQTLKYVSSPNYDSASMAFSDYELQSTALYLNLNEHAKKLLYLSIETNLVETIQWILERMEANEKKPPILDFSKCLILLSGNIDESFAHVKTVSSVFLTPEELAEKVSKVTTATIKSGLFNRFRAEQVARMGTSFVIFKNLSNAQYEQIIDKHLNIISQSIKDSFLLSVTFSKKMNQLIAKNGIVPSQGVRPILSTIGEIIESRVPSWIIALYKSKEKFATVDYNASTNHIQLMVNEKCIFQDQLVFDKLSEGEKMKFSPIQLRYISAHEAGHVVVGLVLNGQLPQRIIFEEGLTQNIPPQVRFSEQPVLTKEVADSNVAMMLAGYAAEKMLFKSEGISSGSSEDLKMATELVSFMISEIGMGGHIGTSLKLEIRPHDLSSFKPQDDLLKDKWLRESLLVAEKVLKDQIKLFEAISEELFKEKKLPIDRLKVLVKENYKGTNDEILKILSRSNHQSFDKLAA